MGRRNIIVLKNDKHNKAKLFMPKRYYNRLYHSLQKRARVLFQRIDEIRCSNSRLRNPNIIHLPVAYNSGKLTLDRILSNNNITGWKPKVLDLRARIQNCENELSNLVREQAYLRENPNEGHDDRGGDTADGSGHVQGTSSFQDAAVGQDDRGGDTADGSGHVQGTSSFQDAAVGQDDRGGETASIGDTADGSGGDSDSARVDDIGDNAMAGGGGGSRVSGDCGGSKGTGGGETASIGGNIGGGDDGGVCGGSRGTGGGGVGGSRVTGDESGVGGTAGGDIGVSDGGDTVPQRTASRYRPSQQARLAMHYRERMKSAKTPAPLIPIEKDLKRDRKIAREEKRKSTVEDTLTKPAKPVNTNKSNDASSVGRNPVVEPAVTGGSTTTADASQGRPSVHGKIAGNAVTLIYQLLDMSKLQKEDAAEKVSMCNDLLSRPLSKGACIMAAECIEQLLANQREGSDLDLVTADCMKVITELQSVEEELSNIRKQRGPKDRIKSSKKNKTETESLAELSEKPLEMASEKPSKMASEFDDDDDDIVTQAYDNYCENDDSELNSASNEVITPAVI